MLRNKFIFSAITVTVCAAALLTSCGGNGNRDDATSGKETTKTTERGTGSIVEEIGSDIKDGIESIGSDIENGMGDVEDATHGTTESETTSDTTAPKVMPKMPHGRHHRAPVPFGK